MSDEVTIQAMAGAIALGLTQVITQATKLPTRYAALCSLLIATVVVVALSDKRGATAVVSGLIAGLSASGLYSGGKAMVKG